MGCHLWGRTELDTTEETAAAAVAEGTNGRITEAEERISEVEDRMMEINEAERQVERNEDNFRDLWGNVKCPNI